VSTTQKLSSRTLQVAGSSLRERVMRTTTRRNLCRNSYDLVTSPAGAVEKYRDEYVCLWVCLSLCLSVCEAISGTTRATFAKFLYTVRGSVFIRHVDDRPHRVSPVRGFLPYWKCIIVRERGMGVHSAGEVRYLRSSRYFWAKSVFT